MTIASNIEAIEAKIARAGQDSPLSASRPTLLAASKGQNEAAIEEAITAGLRLFGENRVQEAQTKWPKLRAAHPDIELHLIGPLQTNKVKEALELFDVIQTLDRKKLAEAIAREMHSEGRPAGRPSLEPSPMGRAVGRPGDKRFYIQVNTGKEPQKGGVLPEEADAFIDDCVNNLHLPVAGLMCIPPAGQPPSPHFALLRNIAQAHGLKELSMGMSEDFETAVRMGTTCVRVGTAIFGERI